VVASHDKIQQQLGFVHRFVPATEVGGRDKTIAAATAAGATPKATTTLLLLHGTGGNEDDLLPLGRELDPYAALLSPRGKILEGGRIPRFFRRLAEGVFDIDDLKYRTQELADFVEEASHVYGFDAHNVVAVGYSNGANIAASMLLLRPKTLSGAILFRAMVPLIPDELPELSGKRIFMSAGLLDPIVTKQEAEKLSKLIEQAGASVILQWQNSGHELTQEDIQSAKHWLLYSRL
jgi:phospholipase/carboxylesterase